MVELDPMVQVLHVSEARKATATALADKGELLGEGNPDIEAMDVEAVAARGILRRREDRGGEPRRRITPGRPQDDPQMSTCFFCASRDI